MRRLTRAARRTRLALVPLAGACIVTQVRYVPAPRASAYTSGSSGPVTPDAAPCAADSWARSDRAVACEVRTFVLAAGGSPVDVESGNGSVAVQCTDTARAATVAATVPTDDDARRLLAAIRVTADGRALRATGPRDRSFDELGWVVDYRITGPRRLDVSARTGNGAVRVQNVVGWMRLSSGNGAITVDGVGGDVEGHTGNGSLHATLAGRAWDDGGLPGAGLDLHSGNGAARLARTE